MNHVICVLGKSDSGKTFFICRYVEFLNASNLGACGFIPFETGQSERNAREIDSDATEFYRYANQNLHPAHCGLYTLYENYPAGFAAACEGIKPSKKLFFERVKFLETHYRAVLLEYGDSLLAPVFGAHESFDATVKDAGYPFVYLINSTPDNFAASLGELAVLSKNKSVGCVLLNNNPPSTDVKWFQFIRDAVTIKSGYDVVGVIPHGGHTKNKTDAKWISTFEAINKNMDIQNS